MWYVAGLCGLIIISAVAGYTRSRNTVDTKQGSDNFGTGIYSTRSLSRSDIDILLARLESEEPPEVVMGAMCYAPMALPSAVDYICPACGEKTVYDSSHASFIEWELAGCRRMTNTINLNTDFDVVLDESLFCDFCSPDTPETPILLLRVVDEGGNEIVNRITIVDLRMLDSFLQGNLYYSTFNDSQRPLQEYADKMRLLLGIEEE